MPAVAQQLLVIHDGLFSCGRFRCGCRRRAGLAVFSGLFDSDWRFTAQALDGFDELAILGGGVVGDGQTGEFVILVFAIGFAIGLVRFLLGVFILAVGQMTIQIRFTQQTILLGTRHFFDFDIWIDPLGLNRTAVRGVI